MKKSLFLIAMVFAFGGFVTSSKAQDWVKMMQDPKANFYDVQKTFNQYKEAWEQKLEAEKRAGSEGESNQS